MSEWKEYKLGGVIELIGGGTPKTNNLSFWEIEILGFLLLTLTMEESMYHRQKRA